MKCTNKIRRLVQNKYHQLFASEVEVVFCLRRNRVYSISTLDNLGFNERFDRVTCFLNPLSGPCFLEGVRAGDVLAIRILDIGVSRDLGISSQGILPEFISKKHSKPVLGKEVVYWEITGGHCFSVCDAEFSRIEVEQELMVGCIRCSDLVDEGACLSSLTADEFGGNLDCKFFKNGATVYLPVTHDSALFYIGDIHFNQTFGEVGGSGIEVPGEVVFTVEKCDRPKHNSLHVEVEGVIYFLGVSDDITQSICNAYGHAFEALVNSNVVDEPTARLLLGHRALLLVMKLGVPNVVVVGVDVKYF